MFKNMEIYGKFEKNRGDKEKAEFGYMSISGIPIILQNGGWDKK